MKGLGNAGHGDLVVDVVIGGNPQRFTVPPGVTIAVPLSDDELAQAAIDGPADAIVEAASTTTHTNAATINQRAAAAIANLEAAAANWGTLTAAQKDAAALLCVRVCSRLARLATATLDQPGQ